MALRFAPRGPLAVLFWPLARFLLQRGQRVRVYRLWSEAEWSARGRGTLLAEARARSTVLAYERRLRGL